jgi:hypothetical protein
MEMKVVPTIGVDGPIIEIIWLKGLMKPGKNLSVVEVHHAVFVGFCFKPSPPTTRNTSLKL